METLKKVWTFWSNCAGTQEYLPWNYRAWNEPMGRFIAEELTKLFYKIFPNYVPKETPELTDKQFRMRVFLILVISFLLYGLIYGLKDIQYMLVSLPCKTFVLPFNADIDCFCIFMSSAIASYIHRILFVKFLGEKDYSVFSVNGLMFWFMGLFLFNIVDGGVYEVAEFLNSVDNATLHKACMYISGWSMLLAFSDFCDTYISFWLSVLAFHIVDWTSRIWFYFCVPGMFVVAYAGLEHIFPMDFFYDLCIVIVTLIITKIFEKYGMMEKIRWALEKFSVLKIFILAVNSVTVIMVIIIILRRIF